MTFKLRRFNTISNIPGEQELVDCDMTFPDEYDESVADETFFVPLSESVRAGQANQGVYDFSDGRDDGRPVPAARIKGHDIVDLQKDVESNKERILKKAKEASDKEIIDAAIRNASKNKVDNSAEKSGNVEN